MVRIFVTIVALLSVAAGHASASKAASVEDKQKAAEMFAAHFDFTRAVHALDMERLVESGFAQPISMKGFERAYQVRFDQPYIDVYGNVYKGNIQFLEKYQREQLGNRREMHFDDFKINGILVKGAKRSDSCMVNGSELRKGCWGVGRVAGVEHSPAPLTFIMPDGEEMVFRSALTKDVQYHPLSGQKQAVIGGVAEVDVAGNTYSFEVSQPLLMTGNCRWLEAGVVEMTLPSDAGGILEFGNAQCSGSYRLSFINGATQTLAKYHDYWK